MERMPWFKWWVGTCADMKLRMLADEIKVPTGCIIAIWAYHLETASNSDERGWVELDAKAMRQMAYTLQFDLATVETVCNGLKREGLVSETGEIMRWEERQGKREKKPEPPGASTKRVQALRDRKKGPQPNENNDLGGATDHKKPETDETVGNGKKRPQEEEVEEEKEEEEESKPKNHVERRNAAPDRDVVSDIFGYWQKTMNSPRALLDDKRKRAIKAALKLGYTPRQLCEAIKGCERSDFHMARGKYAGNNKHNGIGLVLRDAEHIDKFIELASQQVVGEETIEQRNARIMAEFLSGPGAADASAIDADVIEMELEETEQ
jgi:hypothetical protein